MLQNCTRSRFPECNANMPLSLRCEIDQMFNPRKTLHEVDPDLWAAVQQENQRQEDHVELIASENYASPAVLAAQGSQLTNKYAEGYPGKRYYGGCEFVDIAEELAIASAKQLFGCGYANVQPPSGSQANQAVYMAALKPGDAILGMSLAHGGHLTHGAAVNASGKLYRALSYGLNAEETIDYDDVGRLAREHKPRMIVAGASAYSRVIDWRRLREVADEAPAYLMADIAHHTRVIAAKAVAFREALTPEFRAYQKQVITNARTLAKTLQARGVRIVSGGTDCHMLLVDLRAKNVTGRDAEDALGRAHITVNKNAIPNDPQKPFVASGIRLGSPAITTRASREPEAAHLGELIADVLDAPHDDEIIKRVTVEVSELCRRFPVYRAAEAGGGQRVAAA